MISKHARQARRPIGLLIFPVLVPLLFQGCIQLDPIPERPDAGVSKETDTEVDSQTDTDPGLFPDTDSETNTGTGDSPSDAGADSASSSETVSDNADTDSLSEKDDAGTL